MLRPLLLALLPVSLAVAPLIARPAAAVQSSLSRGGPTVPLRYGVILDADRAFYRTGDHVKARVALVNAGPETVGGWTPVAGDLGCAYTFRLEDLLGRVVWTPGTLAGGSFMAPDCPNDPHEGAIRAGEVAQNVATIPLVYQTPTAGALNGTALPPGPYVLKAEVHFISPARHRALFAEGVVPAAQIGILVE